MENKWIIEGNTVYELDESCMASKKEEDTNKTKEKTK